MEGRLETYLKEAVARLEGAFSLEGVYLFGSWARGTADRRSDLDLLVVARTDLPPRERIGRVLDFLQDSPWPVEALALTPEAPRARKDPPFLRRVLKEARPLYERGEEAPRG